MAASLTRELDYFELLFLLLWERAEILLRFLKVLTAIAVIALVEV